MITCIFFIFFVASKTPKGKNQLHFKSGAFRLLFRCDTPPLFPWNAWCEDVNFVKHINHMTLPTLVTLVNGSDLPVIISNHFKSFGSVFTPRKLAVKTLNMILGGGEVYITKYLGYKMSWTGTWCEHNASKSRENEKTKKTHTMGIQWHTQSSPRFWFGSFPIFRSSTIRVSSFLNTTSSSAWHKPCLKILDMLRNRTPTANIHCRCIVSHRCLVLDGVGRCMFFLVVFIRGYCRKFLLFQKRITPRNC